MFERLMERGKQLGERQRMQSIARLAERAGADLPSGIGVEAVEEGIVLIGRGLLRRMLGDARLRAIGFLAKGNGG